MAGWDDAIEDGDISPELAGLFSDAGWNGVDEWLEATTGDNHDVTMNRDDDGNWWMEVDGEQVGPTFTDDNNDVIWEWYQMAEDWADEPPDKAIKSPGAE